MLASRLDADFLSQIYAFGQRKGKLGCGDIGRAAAGIRGLILCFFLILPLDLLLCFVGVHKHFKGFRAGGAATGLHRTVRIAVHNAILLPGADTGFISITEPIIICKSGDARAGRIVVTFAHGTHQHANHLHAGDRLIGQEAFPEILLLDDDRRNQCLHMALCPMAGKIGEKEGNVPLVRLPVGDFLAAGKGHLAHDPFFRHVHLLYSQVVCGDVGVVVAMAGAAPQAVSVACRIDDIAVILPPAALNGAALIRAMAVHGAEILQRSATAQFIYQLGELRLELRTVETLIIAGMPCMPELISIATEINTDMTDGA